MDKGNQGIRYDPDKFRTMIEDGKTAREIAAELRVTPSG